MTAFRWLCGGVAVLPMAAWVLVWALAWAPARAQAPQKVPPACWFYQYQWVYYRMISNVAPPTTYPTGGSGTGVMVTDGTPPTEAESEALIADIVRTLPRGDAAAPPPRAFMQGISRIACPKQLAGMDLALAKIWLRQPEPATAPQPAGSPQAGSPQAGSSPGGAGRRGN